jgi:hypothetical protein
MGSPSTPSSRPLSRGSFIPYNMSAHSGKVVQMEALTDEELTNSSVNFWCTAIRQLAT